MRNIIELRKLPISELTDEEVVKVMRDKLNAPMVMLVYTDETGNGFFLGRWKGPDGKKFWNKLITAWQDKYGKMDSLEEM